MFGFDDVPQELPEEAVAVSAALSDREIEVLMDALTVDPEDRPPAVFDVMRALLPRLLSEVLFHRAANKSLTAQ